MVVQSSLRKVKWSSWAAGRKGKRLARRKPDSEFEAQSQIVSNFIVFSVPWRAFILSWGRCRDTNKIFCIKGYSMAWMLYWRGDGRHSDASVGRQWPRTMQLFAVNKFVFNFARLWLGRAVWCPNAGPCKGSSRRDRCGSVVSRRPSSLRGSSLPNWQARNGRSNLRDRGNT